MKKIIIVVLVLLCFKAIEGAAKIQCAGRQRSSPGQSLRERAIIAGRSSGVGEAIDGRYQHRMDLGALVL